MEYIVIDNTSSSSSSSRTTTPACTTSTPLDAPLDAETLLLSLKNSTVTKHEIRMITTTTTHVMTFAVSSPPSKQRGVSGYSLFVAFHSVALDTSSSPGSTKRKRDTKTRTMSMLWRDLTPPEKRVWELKADAENALASHAFSSHKRNSAPPKRPTRGWQPANPDEHVDTLANISPLLRIDMRVRHVEDNGWRGTVKSQKGPGWLLCVDSDDVEFNVRPREVMCASP